MGSGMVWHLAAEKAWAGGEGSRPAGGHPPVAGLAVALLPLQVTAAQQAKVQQASWPGTGIPFSRSWINHTRGSYFDLVEAHLLSLGGRPHWGKTYNTESDFCTLYGENMGKLKTVRILRVQKVYVWQGYLGSSHSGDDQQTVTYPNQDALLLKEVDETNNWARLASQLYFGWFTLLLTANALTTCWVFMYNSTLPTFAPLVFGVFIVLNLMGIIATSRIHENLLDSDQRIKEVIETLARHHLTNHPCSKPQSPVPLQAINAAFRFTGAALITLMLFWTALEIWWALVRLQV
jgi:hypothetical protein